MLLYAIITLSLSLCVLACPPEDDIAPFCQCRHIFGFNMMICEGFDNPEQMMKPFQAVAHSDTPVFSLSIEKSTLLYIPNDVFQNTTLQKLRFADTQVMSLSDSDLAFLGLEDTLEEIRATSEQYVTQWDWGKLRNMRALNLIDVNYISMGSIEEPLPYLPKLRFLGITMADLSFIVDGAFQSLESLTVLNMHGNDLKTLKRNYFPNPAKNLLSIDLSFNQLSELPEDFFTNMPVLEYLRLERNKFVLLPEKIFAWPVKHLQDFILTENPIRCDCRMRWMIKMRKPLGFIGNCASPKQIKGTSITDLQMRHLWC